MLPPTFSGGRIRRNEAFESVQRHCSRCKQGFLPRFQGVLGDLHIYRDAAYHGWQGDFTAIFWRLDADGDGMIAKDEWMNADKILDSRAQRLRESAAGGGGGGGAGGGGKD